MSKLDVDVLIARQNVVGGFNRLKRVAEKINDCAWKSFFAGAMNMFTKQIDGQLAEFGVEMKTAKPGIGNIIEPNTPADICEAALQDATKAILDVGNIPRRLTIGPDDEKFYGQQKLADLAREFGLILSKDETFDDSEWTVDDLLPGDNRNTYWNPGV